jgi:hypothetical protein
MNKWMKGSKQHNTDLLYLTGLKYCNGQYRQVLKQYHGSISRVQDREVPNM